jgi:hypothetical protein
MTAREDAARALVHRLKNRGDGDNQYALDDDVFAGEYITALLGNGWRPVEALAPWDYRNAAHGAGLPVSEEARRQVEQARRDSAEASIRRRTLAANPPRDAA